MRAYLVDSPDQVHPEWLEGVQSVGVTAGASAPDVLVQEILERLRALGVTSVREEDGERETVVFQMPAELQ